MESSESLASRLRSESLKRRIDALKSHQIIPQGTDEWLSARRLLLTASDVACFLTHSEEHARAYVDEFSIKDFRFSKRCASPYSSGKQVLKRKHGIVASMADNVFTGWGHTFEPVIRSLWQFLHGGKEVLEFGLITSNAPNSLFLAASPDGISPELGICLEFKAPLSRNICVAQPLIPFHYWIQMQVQMECCDLPKGHYLECAFSMYASDEQFLSDEIDEDEHKGVLLKNGPRCIETPPLQMWSDAAAQLDWAKQAQQENQQIVRWKMIGFNLIEVQRNRPWMLAVLPTLRQAYHELLHFDHAKAQMEDEEKKPRAKRAKKPSFTKEDTASVVDLCGSEQEDEGDLCGGD